MKPGKPTTFATVVSEDGQQVIFAAWESVSSMVVFKLLVEPAIKRCLAFH